MPSITLPNEVRDKLPTLLGLDAARDYAVKIGFTDITNRAIQTALYRGELKYHLIRNRRRFSPYDIRAWLMGETK